MAGRGGDDWTQGWDYEGWRRRVKAELIPKIGASAFVASMVTGTEPDIKFAVELGLSILMDKPIIAVVTPGVKVPDKLAMVCDRLIEGDLNDPQGTSRRMAETIAELSAELGLDDD